MSSASAPPPDADPTAGRTADPTAEPRAAWPSLADATGAMALWATWANSLAAISQPPPAAAPAPDADQASTNTADQASADTADQASADTAEQASANTADQAIGAMLAASVQQLRQSLERDPLLQALDQAWNANPLRDIVPVNWAEIARSLRLVWLGTLERPADALASLARLQASMWSSAMAAWGEAGQRWLGLPAAPGPSPRPDARSDKRFAAPEWHSNPAFRSLRDLYLLAADWLAEPERLAAVPAAERPRVRFHLRQFIDATSPSLALLSNPAAMRRAVETGGGSLADGLRHLLADLREGRLSITDADAFAPGRNLALTPGQVVHRDALIELIQYAPSTPSVHAVPLLVLPPWINKFYILDLQPKNSMIRWLVAQGFTVFVVSWRNPDAAMEATGFEDYVRLGCLAASDIVRQITRAPRLNVMGYCIGGTMLSMALAWLAKRGDHRFVSATLMVSLQDFAQVGDTAMFLGEDSMDLVERQMLERGYLDGRQMSNMFSLLRSNDLIWANVVNNYLMGEKPAAFDILSWNADETRMARAAHTWYLRQTYTENNLIQPDRVRLMDETLDLARVTLPVYAVGAEKDHIVPWSSAWRATQLFGGEVRYVLASSGHVAGMINPPGGKGTYWTTAATDSAASMADSAATWRQQATATDGSWWTDWAAWLAARSGAKVKPPRLGSKAHPPLMDAPGRYVLEK